MGACGSLCSQVPECYIFQVYQRRIFNELYLPLGFVFFSGNGPSIRLHMQTRTISLFSLITYLNTSRNTFHLIHISCTIRDCDCAIGDFDTCVHSMGARVQYVRAVRARVQHARAVRARVQYVRTVCVFHYSISVS